MNTFHVIIINSTSNAHRILLWRLHVVDTNVFLMQSSIRIIAWKHSCTSSALRCDLSSACSAFYFHRISKSSKHNYPWSQIQQTTNSLWIYDRKFDVRAHTFDHTMPSRLGLVAPVVLPLLLSPTIREGNPLVPESNIVPYSSHNYYSVSPSLVQHLQAWTLYVIEHQTRCAETLSVQGCWG